MGYITKVCLALLLCTILSISALPSVQAESQSTMHINAEITDSHFWDYTFIKDGIPIKAAVIKVEWSFGNMGNNAKDATIILSGKTSGQVNILSAKGQSVNINLCVKSAKNDTLGKWSLQVANTGQTESVVISLPETIEPLITSK